MLFVSFQVRNFSYEKNRLSNIMLEDTIEPKNQLDLLNLTMKIENELKGDSITILWWKLLL